MKLLWPWGLLSLLPIAAAAVWAIRRPLHRVVPVSSLRLWQKALDALGPAAARSARRVTAAWVLLLAGAAVAGIAFSRPTWYADAPARRIAVAVYPGAELAGPGQEALAQSVAALLGRLEPADRVRLILPTVLGGVSEFLSPDEAAGRLREIGYLPVPAEKLTLPAPDGQVQHLYRFAPATLPAEDGPTTTTIALPAGPGEVTIDAFGVEPLPEGSAEIFVALRNHTAGRKRGVVRLGRGGDEPMERAFDLPPDGAAGLHADLPGEGEHYSAAIAGATGPGARAFAVPARLAISSVAMIGRDDPHIRRFVRIHPALRLAADPAKADVVVAIGSAAAQDKPALIIAPPAPPPGFSAAGTLENIALRDAAVLRDYPPPPGEALLSHVRLDSVAVREATAWRSPGDPDWKRLVTLGENVLMLAAENPRRVYLAFDLATVNTNFTVDPSFGFVIFMANVTEFLAPTARGQLAYEFTTPLQAGPRPDWRPAEPGGQTAPARSGPLPWPGLYRDEDGVFRAVNLLGLRSARPEVEPTERAARAALPDPRPLSEGRELWPLLAVLAAALWLSGWALRLR